MEQLFVFGKPVGKQSFTDREVETARLSANFSAGINTFLISPRRWGKTSLVKQVIEHNKNDGLLFVFVDVFKTKTASEFCSMLANAVLRQTSTAAEELIDNVKGIFRRLSVGINLSPDKMNPLNIEFNLGKDEESFEEILSIPARIAEKKNARVIICIDEFQQVAQYDDSNTFQKVLRTVWQHQENVTYCLFGSKRHMMESLFDDESKPFFKFGDIVYLKRIPFSYWRDYISGKFSSQGKVISDKQIERICTAVDFHSSYVQQLCWYVFLYSGKTVTDNDIDEGINELIAQNTALFESRTESLSPTQMRFLTAVASGVSEGFSSSQVISKYKLGSSALSVATRKSLLEKGLLFIEDSKVSLSDPVMAMWLLDS